VAVVVPGNADADDIDLSDVFYRRTSTSRI
jgi:hypothetical protein